MTPYTGVSVLEVSKDKVDKVHQDGKIEIWDNRHTFYPNQFVYLKSVEGQTGVITVVNNNFLKKVNDKLKLFGIKAKNKEQKMAMSVLADNSVPLCVLTGKAGTGKTLISLAAALQAVEDGNYDRILITRPMSQVGKYNLGALPGTVDEKFGPYLENYLNNIQQLIGNDSATAEILQQQMNITAMPLQLIRGASWVRTFVIADEVQTLDHDEMLTLGTRIGEGSKLVVLGDLRQRDEKIAKVNTGLYKLMNDPKAKKSPLISAIELIKCERSPLSALIAEIFEDE